MRKFYQRINAEMVKALSENERVCYARIDNRFIVAANPFHCAYILPEDWILFNPAKAMRNDSLETLFISLISSSTIKKENEITPTDMYISGNGKQFNRMYTGDDRLTGKKYKVLLNTAYTKDVNNLYCNFYQEDPESLSKRGARIERRWLPVLAAKVDPVNGVDFVPLKIILPIRTFEDEERTEENEHKND